MNLQENTTGVPSLWRAGCKGAPPDRRNAATRRPGAAAWFVILALFLVFPAGCCSSQRPLSRAEAAPSSRTLVWISIDGVRPDYLDRAATPYFDGLTAEGAFSIELIPLFPTLTFPAHVTKATGTAADGHGITGNVIYDSVRDRSYGYPGFPWLLEAEPIWTTATRQGVVTAVFGWPLSHRQAGEHAARYFDEAFDRDLTDRQRLEKMLEIWRGHDADPPLRLLMGYVIGPDAEGHLYGPDAPETAARMAATDTLLAEFERELLEIWKTRRRPGDELYLLVTSDHGMSPVHTLVNPRICAGLPARGSPVRRVSNGNITHFFLNRIEDPRQRAQKKKNLLARLRSYDFLEVYERHELPAQWRYRHPRRTGDIVAVLPRGYTFSNRIRSLTLPSADQGGPLGMHGYCPQSNPQMLTTAFLQRYPVPLGGFDLGAFTMDRLHATAARILGVGPAPGAHPEAVGVPGLE